MTDTQVYTHRHRLRFITCSIQRYILDIYILDIDILRFLFLILFTVMRPETPENWTYSC